LQLYQWYLTLKENDWEVITFKIGKNNADHDEIRNIPTSLVNRFWNIHKIVKSERPKFILQRAADRDTLIISLIAMLLNVKFVYMGAHDADFIRRLTFSYYIGLSPIKKIILGLQFYFGLKITRYFIIQNEVQRGNLQKITNSKNIIKINNIWHRTKYPRKLNEKSILWVGNFRPMKRPNLFISIAKKFPEYRFIMIGAVLDKQLFDRCLEQGGKLKNLTIVGPVPYFDIDSYFASSKLFISTSTMEGFPNVFLQAWDFNIPIITTCDPDNTISKNKLGIFCENESQIVNSISILMNNEQLYKEYKNRIEAYISSNHNPQEEYYKMIKMLGL